MVWFTSGFILGGAMALLALSMLLVVIRMIIGPSLPDRVAALDLFSVQFVCMILCFQTKYSDSVFLDVVLALSLITFLGTVAFSKYIEKGVGR